MDVKMSLVLLCVLSVYCVAQSAGESVNYDKVEANNGNEGVVADKNARGVEALKTKRSSVGGKFEISSRKPKSGGERRGVFKGDENTYIDNTVHSQSTNNNDTTNTNKKNIAKNYTVASNNQYGKGAEIGEIIITGKDTIDHQTINSIKKTVQIGYFDIQIELFDLRNN